MQLDFSHYSTFKVCDQFGTLKVILLPIYRPSEHLMSTLNVIINNKLNVPDKLNRFISLKGDRLKH